MSLILKTCNNEAELIAHIKTHEPSFYFSSRTSTVIPYDKLEEFFCDQAKITLCDLSKLPSEYSLLENGNLKIRGPLTWLDARLFLKSKNRNIKTSPTEDLALITAGAATSCTGERCFGYGNLRGQIKRIKYFNYLGEEVELSHAKKIEDSDNKLGLKKYAENFEHYKNYKNAPYPRFEVQTDLMIGTEGQLGIISEIEIETVELFPVTYFFLLLPKWEENYLPHLEVYKKIQKYRREVLSCELVDANAFSFLKDSEKLGKNQDVIFLEIKSSEFEIIYEDFLSQLELIKQEDMFEISEENFHHVRASIPRAVFEANTKAGVVKMGTDVQVGAENFQALLDFYRTGKKTGIDFNLFGHFGDAHLHFNFMPRPEQSKLCLDFFNELYSKVIEWQGSPFAEHGIGILKQKFITHFINNDIQHTFKVLKTVHDPYTQFFPKGFMLLENY